MISVPGEPSRSVGALAPRITRRQSVRCESDRHGHTADNMPFTSEKLYDRISERSDIMATKQAITKITLNVDSDLLQQVDAYATRLHITRTAAVMVLLSKGLEQVSALESMDAFVKMMQELKDSGVIPAPPVG